MRTKKTDRGVLSARRVATLKKPGMYSDGGNLYLQVTENGKSWILRFHQDGRQRQMGLGSFVDVSLAKAREKAAECRVQLRDGLDPIEERRRERLQRRAALIPQITFSECASRHIAAQAASWHNKKHKQQWENTLKTYAEPVIGQLPVQAIDTGLVLEVLEPIWTTKPETASRVRQRMESVLNWASARGYRAGENPARFRGHLDKLLPKTEKIKRQKHHAAMRYEDVAKFYDVLRGEEGIPARALEFTILTAARTGETILARWEEFDLGSSTWTIPLERMKAGREHRVPLPARAQEIVEQMQAFDSEFVFPGQRYDKPLSNMGMLAVLKRLRGDLTVHGFRSTFRDWAAEQTSFPHEVAEMALAHTIKNKAEAAYRRRDLFDKRREMMDAWASYVEAGESQSSRMARRRS